MVKSFVNNGWCVQIRGPQAGGAVADLPIHLYDLGTGNQVKIPSEVMIPETREFEFANLGFIPLSYYKNRDYACFFSANSAQKPALYDTADATANSRINARLLPAVPHCSLPENYSAREYRHHQRPPRAGTGA
jgi:type VI secretion system protein ImpC